MVVEVVEEVEGWVVLRWVPPILGEDVEDVEEDERALSRFNAAYTGKKLLPDIPPLLSLSLSHLTPHTPSSSLKDSSLKVR